jgi:hypothetical protein
MIIEEGSEEMAYSRSWNESCPKPVGSLSGAKERMVKEAIQRSCLHGLKESVEFCPINGC